MPTISVQVDDPASPEARALVAQLDEFLISRYPSECNHLLPVEALKQANATFLIARVDGELAGCGAFVNHGGSYAELKRMYVAPKFRGLKLGRHILQTLEGMIRDAGIPLARLETGIYQTEAIQLYEKSGYLRRAAFGDYPEHSLSVFMEKELGA